MSARVLRAEAAGARVVKADVMEAKEEAAAIVRQARQEADAIREGAREEGRRAGLAEGVAEGRARLARALSAAAEARAGALKELESAALEVALMAAKAIVGDELATDPTRAQALVAPLLQRLRRAKRITIRVHPQDEATLRQACRAPLDGELRIEGDVDLERGDCVVESDIGTLDARLDIRLSAIAAALRGS